MPKYRVHLTANASASIDVEAEDDRQAIEKAVDNAPGSLCHQCAREVTLGDFDLNVDVGERVADYVVKIEG